MQTHETSIEQQPVKNFWPGRGQAKPLAIVEGRLPASLAEIFEIFDGKPNRNGVSYKVSAHYAIGRDGRVWQFVQDEDTAWANGVTNQPDPNLDWLHTTSNPNLVTLAIGYEGTLDEALSEAQYAAALALHRQLITRWQIPPDSQHIVGHDKLDSVARTDDPGPNFPWSHLFEDLGQKTDGQDELQEFDRAMTVAETQPQSEPEDELAELEAFMLEPEPGIRQQEAALYEIDADEKNVANPAQTQIAAPESETYDLELDKILARKDEPQPAEESGSYELELDKILAQAAATEARLHKANQANAVDDEDFGLPSWLEESTPTSNVATAEIEADEPTRQFEVGELLNQQSEPQAQTQAFAIQAQPPTNVTKTMPLPTSQAQAVTSNEETESSTSTPQAAVETASPSSQSSTPPIQSEAGQPNSTQTTPTSQSNTAPKFDQDNIRWEDLGLGVVKVELANVRHQPNFEPDTVMRTVEEGMRLHLDASQAGPELYGNTLWFHITRSDGDGWIHSALVERQAVKSL